MTSAAVDIFDPKTYGQGVPHEELRRLRDEQPVSWQEESAVGEWPAGPGYWAVTRYADVRTVLASSQDFSSWLGGTQIRDPDADDLPFIRQMMLNMDAPEHLRLRRLVTSVFSNRRLEAFSERVRQRARAMIANIAQDGRCDFTVDVTDDFPLLNLCDLMGVPASDRHLMLEWTNRVIGFQDPEHGHVTYDEQGRPVNPRSPAMLQDMFAYALDLAAEKRRTPADDVMTALVQARYEDQRLSDAELKMFFFLLVIAGNDTTRSALPGGALAFAEHPDQYQRLRQDPALLPTAVEEILRWHPPVLTFRRTASRHIELGGESIRAGDKVVVYHVSANYDEREFPEPFRFDIARTPNRHLAFGHGPHKCLGAHFARIQMSAFFGELIRAVPAMEVDGPVVRLTSNFINGIKHLPLSWNVTPSVATD